MLTFTNYLPIKKYSTLSFKSNKEREKELLELERLKREREELLKLERLKRERTEAERKYILEQIQRKEQLCRTNEVIERVLNDTYIYPEVDNQMSVKFAGFISKFTCAIQNNSEHDIREFFGDEETAKELRKKLSPECQHDSLELRREIQKIHEAQDPVMMLIAANNMKRFVPKAGILSLEQHANLIEGLKNTIIMSVKNSDMSKFDEDDKISIGEMLQLVKVSDGINFGISVKLKQLIDKLNGKILKLGFIPPVQVSELKTMAKKVKK